MRPSTRARYSTDNGSSTIAARSSRAGAGDDDESCGIRRPTRRRSRRSRRWRSRSRTPRSRWRGYCQGRPATGHRGSTIATQPGHHWDVALDPVSGACVSPECHKSYATLGFEDSTREVNGVAMPDGPAYFTSRGSILGQVPGEVVAAAFGVFNPEVVVPCVEAGMVAHGRAHDRQPARTEGATEQLRRVLGDEPDGLDRVNELLARAVEPLRPEGRSLYAGLRALGVPADPLAAMWRRCDMLREFRGDSHITSWVSAGLDATEIGLLTELFWGLPMRSYSRTSSWTTNSSTAPPSVSNPAVWSPTAPSPRPVGSCTRRSRSTPTPR